MNFTIMRILLLVFFCSFAISGIKCGSCKKQISGQYYIEGSKKYHETCYRENIMPKCKHCNKPITGSYIPSKSGSYHEQCYKHNIAPKCGVCSKPLSGSYMSDASGSYHEVCYKNHVLPKCDACMKPLETQYGIDSWGNKFHNKHKNRTGICSSCSRIVSDRTTNGGFKHSDRRVICNICNSKSIASKSDIEKSRIRVLNKLQSKGFQGLSNKVPIKVVNRNKLMKLRGGNPDIRGLTDYKYQFSQNSRGEKIDETKEYVIYILDKMPKIAFDAVLAHEYLHVWLFENNLDYKSSITEGFCNLGAFAIYDSKDTDFAQIQLQIMNENPDPDYGKGYRGMKKCLDRKGWGKLIKDVKKGRARLCR